MLPTDPWHEFLAAERAALITQLELAYEGCSEHGRENIMNTTPKNGDTGDEKKHVEMEPVEVPLTVPAEPVPA